jgi:hypothetical protein
MKKLFNKEFFWLCLIWLVAFVLVLPLLKPGFYPFHDEPHIANLYQMARAIESGQLPPRWGPDFSYNFGYPFFVFYYPLPFYLGAFFNLVFGLNLIWSLKLVFLFSLPLSATFFYFLSRKFFNREGSFVASVIYLLTPYRAVDLYVRGAVGELWSFVFMPAVLLTFFNLIQKRTLKSVTFAGLSLAALVLSHNLSAIIFLPFVLFFCLALIFKEKNKIYGLVSSVLGGLLGLAISAYYWLPAVWEKQFVQSGTPFNPFDHFPFIKQLITPFWGYGASVWGPHDGLSFQIGIVNLLAVLLGFLLFVLRKKIFDQKRQVLFLFLAFSFLLCLFLMNIRSGFIWKLLPLGSYVQFPWRFLLLTTLFSSLFVGFLEAIPKLGKKIVLLFAVLAFVLNFQYFKPEKTVLVDDNHYLDIMFAGSEKYTNYSEDYLPLTVWTQERPSSLPLNKIEVIEGEVEYQEKTPIHFTAQVTSEKQTSLVLHQYYFPGWQAKVDGQRVELQINKPHGDILIPLDQGNHQVEIWFGRSGVRLISEIISLGTVLILLAAFTWKKIKK